MHTEIELKAYKIIDDYLTSLIDNKEDTIYKLKESNKKEDKTAYRILVNYELIIFLAGKRNPSSKIEISPLGEEIIKTGGYKKYIDKVENRDLENKKRQEKEDEKLNVDLELKKKILKEYPKTKWFARIGFTLSILAVLFEIVNFFFF